VTLKETFQQLFQPSALSLGEEEALGTPEKSGGKLTAPPSARSNFSEEAEGIGPAAEHLGATLDACAGVIDAMVSELDSGAAEKKCPPENPSAPPLEETEVPDSVSAMTSSIPSLEEPMDQSKLKDAKSAAIGEEDDWSMVSEGSQALAKATNAIGSALFELDKKSSAELADSGIDSIPSSVPTVSTPSPWAEELKKLRELGFADDKASIEALELLNKEASAPVPIENVVDYMCLTADTDEEAED